MYAISTLLFLVAEKASRVPKGSFNNFWNFAGYANHRCTGHATMSTKRANDRLITVHAPAFLVLAIAGNQKWISNMAINWGERKFENNLQTALKESLALFPVD